MKKLLAFALLLILIFAGCKSKPEKVECVEISALLTDFEKYARQSDLPVIENPNSLCHGISGGFDRLEPKWAAAKLVSVEKETAEIKLNLEGITTPGEMYFPASYKKLFDLDIGKYYKLDMMNICRYMAKIVDSRYPSPIEKTFVMPTEITCGQESVAVHPAVANN